MARRKRIVQELEIIDIVEKGRGLGRRPDGKVVFVDNVVPGDIVDVRIRRSRKDYAEGFPVAWHKYSDLRVTPRCQHFKHCGGCQWQNVGYEDQLRFKENIVRSAMKRIGKAEIETFLPILGAQEIYNYRNKLEYSYSNKKWLPPELLNTDVSNVENVLGYHVKGSYDKILDIKECHLQVDPSNSIRLGLKQIAIDQNLDFYDARAEQGFLRQVMIRMTTLEEIMILVSFFYDDQNKISSYLNEIKKRFPEIASIYFCINAKKNDYMFDREMIQYDGKGSITEQLGNIRFSIGPKSFFQTNTRQGQQLFDLVVEFADLNGSENVYDLYTGIGSIALYIARSCANVVAIEEIKAAIEDAINNAKANAIENVEFYTGDVKDMLTPEFRKRHGKPDVLITDPPRAGMHPKVVNILLELESPKIVYVSCNPATQARDLGLLSEKYQIKKMRPVDMFPHTHHVENVALLSLKE
ncbi:MAG: 23S rRNA (uracil(1939)-C(5))-methyltransferase RlmD [Bacteroidia bacterium]|nr:23S rRNA (uracil(1939)-C(5))-methyltransferase RlmD [Bacteroidia bacterium]